MKPMTITAVVALLVTLPFILQKRKACLLIRKWEKEMQEQDLRYAIDDFLM